LGGSWNRRSLRRTTDALGDAFAKLEVSPPKTSYCRSNDRLKRMKDFAGDRGDRSRLISVGWLTPSGPILDVGLAYMA
jgi:hypothetical protein